MPSETLKPYADFSGNVLFSHLATFQIIKGSKGFLRGLKGFLRCRSQSKKDGVPHLSAETVEKVRVFLRVFEDNKKLISTSEIAKALQVIKNSHYNGCNHQELAGLEVPAPKNQLPRRPPLASAKPRSVTVLLLVLVSSSRRAEEDSSRITSGAEEHHSRLCRQSGR